MFIFLDKKRKKFSQWLKNKTTIDFSDWSVLILFILGLFAIFYFGQGADFSNRTSVIVLWFTAIAILQYTKETYWLKQIQNKQIKEIKKGRYLEKMPMIRLISWDIKDKDLSLPEAQKTFTNKEDKHFYKVIYKNIGDDWAFIEKVTLWVANPLVFQKKIDINYPSFKKTLFKGEKDIINTYRVETRHSDGTFLYLYPSKLKIVFRDRYNHRFTYIVKKVPHVSEPTPFLGIYDAVEEEVVYPSDLK
jgi:hypothetical protein